MLDIKECYICMETCDNLSSCDCKSMYIHRECQLVYMTKKDTKICSICKKPYRNIILVEKIKKYYTSFCYIKYLLYLFCIIFNLIFISLGIIFIYNCTVLDSCDEIFAVYTSFLSLIDCVVIGGVILFRLYIKQHNIKMIETIKSPSKLSIV
jgi:hypothetical protein